MPFLKELFNGHNFFNNIVLIVLDMLVN